MEKVKIIYEDNDVILFEKPAFMVTTNENNNESGTLEDYFRKIRPNNLPRNGILHRLDKGTSGLVLGAKTQESFEFLKKQFKQRNIKKKYYCLVGGKTSFEGEINLPTGRSKYQFGKFAVKDDGKQSVTKFNLISVYKKDNKFYSLLDIDLKTGRTHQIRVHMSHLRWPLVGDKLYGGEDKDIKRPFLHAYQISFIHPIQKELLTFKIELPNDLKLILDNYEKD
jgi:23S rRNA pseudouridine1911/1915/1917 synthase